MNTGDVYIRLVEDGPRSAPTERAPSSPPHSFAPLLASSGEQWRLESEGIYTHARPGGESHDENGFTIRLSVYPAIADEVLRKVAPVIISSGSPFKFIANTALLELACSKVASLETAVDFIIIYPPTRSLFNDLTVKLQNATRGITADIPTRPDIVERATLGRDNPWPGLDSYLPNECGYFYGRADERIELVQCLEQAVITAILGEPGVGKTSLLRAGLQPAFDRLRLEPVYLRLHCAGSTPPVQQVRDEINRVLRERQIDGAPFGEGQTLWEYFHQQNAGWLAADGKPVVPILLFDQFEDILAFEGAPAGRQQIEAFWRQLGDLVENRGPKTPGQLTLPYFGSRTGRDLFKVILSLRQDQLSQLTSRRAEIPSLAGDHFVLQPLNGRKALEAVLGPGRRLLDPAYPDALAEQITRRLVRETTQPEASSASDGSDLDSWRQQRVDPALLSFFCRQLNEARKKDASEDGATAAITTELIDAAGESILEDFFQRTHKARPLIPQPQIAPQQVLPEPEEKAPPIPVVLPALEAPPAPEAPAEPDESPVPEALPVPVSEPPPAPIAPVFVEAESGDREAGRLRYMAFGLGLLLLILVPILVVTYLEKLQRHQTDLELEEFIANLDATRNTLESANRRLTLTESNLALKESNLLVLSQQTREEERATLEAKAQNLRLADDQTNLQTRIIQLNRAKARAEARLAQWGSLLADLTNQIANLNQQMDALEARNNSLAVSNLATIWNSTSNWLAPTNSPDTNRTESPTIEGMPEKPAVATMPQADHSSPRGVAVLATHGDCLYSKNGLAFAPLHFHEFIFAGTHIRTGKKSWIDLFFRKTGTTVRVAAESEIKIAKLSAASENGVPLTDTLLELRQGRIFTVVRALVPGNTLEISDATGHSIIEGGGLGCYMITAPRTNSTEKLSVTPLRLVTQSGISTVMPGQKYAAKDGISMTLVSTKWEKMLLELDQLEDETDRAIAEPDPSGPANKN